MSKTKRFAAMRTEPCLVCGRVPTDVCHLRSVGATGNDDKENLFSLCRRHHAEQHTSGFRVFFIKYPEVRTHLEARGWKFEYLNGKFIMEAPVKDGVA